MLDNIQYFDFIQINGCINQGKYSRIYHKMLKLKNLKKKDIWHKGCIKYTIYQLFNSPILKRMKRININNNVHSPESPSRMCPKILQIKNLFEEGGEI